MASCASPSATLVMRSMLMARAGSAAQDEARGVELAGSRGVKADWSQKPVFKPKRYCGGAARTTVLEKVSAGVGRFPSPAPGRETDIKRSRALHEQRACCAQRARASMARASGWRTFKGMRASTWWSPLIVLYVVGGFLICLCSLAADAVRALLSNAQECAPWENVSWCISLGTLLASAFATMLAVCSNHRTMRNRGHLIIVATGLPPKPHYTALPDSKRWHIFLSHTWKTGQDQVLNIKQSLQALLPGIKVTLAPPYPLLVPTFALAPAPSPDPALAAYYSARPTFDHLLVRKVWLDVDELDDLAKLEEYVRGSVLVLAFISKGYFLSANCQRELKAAIDADPES